MGRLTWKSKQTGRAYAYFEDVDVIGKLAEYEDLEEQGLLVRLPCKIGDTVWVLFDTNIIEECIVLSIRLGEKDDTIYFKNGSCYTVWDKNYFDKKFFLTKAEAEEALKKMEEGAVCQ